MAGFGSGFGIGLGQQTATDATGVDPLSNSNNNSGQPRNTVVQNGNIPLRNSGAGAMSGPNGSHWSVLPMIGQALGIGPQQQAQPQQPQGGNSVLPVLGHLFGLSQTQPSIARPTFSGSPTISAGGNNYQLPSGSLYGGTTSISSLTPPPVSNPAPINTQQSMGRFSGIVPTIGGFYANHQAAQRDSLAQPHIDALQSANMTPEQRQYHINNLQSIYRNQPQVLQQMGIPMATGGYSVPVVSQ